MKKLILFLAVYCMTQSARAGCGFTTLRTSNGIAYSIFEHAGQTASITTLDSFVVQFDNTAHSGCKYYENLVIELDNRLVLSLNSWSGNKGFIIKGSPGHYRVRCYWLSVGCYLGWEFDLVLIPVEVDSTKYETGLSAIKVLNPEFLLYPNPAENTISFLNELEQIKTVFIYDLNGKNLVSIEVNSTNADIPINNLPLGIYFLQAATVSEKVIIKKFIKQ